MEIRRLRFARSPKLIGAFAASIVAAVSGCTASTSRPQEESLNSVEINGDRLPLPQTQLVMCTAPGEEQYRFWWQGSDMLVPRHPLDDKYSSSVSLSFALDPPVPQSLDLQIYWHGEQLDLSWPSAYGFAGDSPALDSSLPHNYTLSGTLTSSDSASPQYYVRIQFNC
jgi:hypothetical protein